MKIEEGSVITLDNKISYIVVDIINYNSTNYLYLCTTKKPIRIEIAIITQDKFGDFQIELLTDVKQKSLIYGMFLDCFKNNSSIYNKVC